MAEPQRVLVRAFEMSSYGLDLEVASSIGWLNGGKISGWLLVHQSLSRRTSAIFSVGLEMSSYGLVLEVVSSIGWLNGGKNSHWLPTHRLLSLR